jgi:DNA ligase-1
VDGAGRFEQLMKTVMDRQPDELAWQRISYQVFDLPDSRKPFAERYMEMGRLVQAADSPYLRRKRQQRIEDRE